MSNEEKEEILNIILSDPDQNHPSVDPSATSLAAVGSNPIANESNPIANDSNSIENESNPIANDSNPIANDSNPIANESNTSTVAGVTVDKNEDGDSEDDDDIQVTIGPVNTTPGIFSASSGAPVNLNIQKRGPSAFEGIPSSSNKAGSGTVKQLDLDTEGSVNGENIFDVDPSTLEDKPWRKPGADITDYFNYGFNEDTWKVCVHE